MRPTVRGLRPVAIAGACLLLGVAALRGQRATRPSAAGPAPTGALAGQAVFAATGEAVAFSLVALTSVEGDALVRNELTAADGSFRFDSLAPGEYQLRLERVGFAAEVRPPVRVVQGRTVSVTIRSSPRRVALPATSPADTACRAAATIAAAPALAVLWQQAATAAEARRIFDRRYTFTVVARDLNWRVAGTSRVRAMVSETPLTHTPTEALVEELRSASSRPIWGTVGPGGFRLIVPDLVELFGTGFLATHCIAGGRPGPGHETTIRLVPRDNWTTEGALRLAPTIVLDSTLAVARVELEYRLDGRPIVRGAQEYTDGGLPGGQLRFPRRLDLEEIPRLAGADHWVGRTHYDNYRVVPDTAR